MNCNFCTKMFKFCRTNHVYIYAKKQSIRPTHSFHSACAKEHTSLKFDSKKEPDSNFLTMIDFRLKEAKRTVLVQVKSDTLFSQFNEYCYALGKVNNIYNYVLPNSKLCFSVVEFEDKDTISEIQLRCTQSNWELLGTQYLSPFLLYHCMSNESKNVSNTNGNINNGINYGTLPNEQEIANNLIKMETISDQILKLYEVTKLDDLGIRLRFLIAFQIESALSGILPGSQCLLFGSSVNGCGRLNSDVDLVLNFNSEYKNKTSNNELRYQLKTNYANDRTRLQKHMEVIADLIHNFLPGCHNVVRILQARVPIIKYKHEYTGIDCDLSLTNNNAVTMSKLLYTLSGVDWRIRPILLTIKHWAEKNDVTNRFPGRWISNFSLSLLVIFYLQKIKIIPSIDHCVVLKRVCDNEVMCTFLEDVIQTFKNENHQTITLSEILLGFFEYYLNFDFDSKGISLNSGQIVNKRNTFEAMYIVNPLDQELNVSKNVSVEEISSLKMKLTEASELLSSQIMRGKDDTNEWGLILLLKASVLQKKKIDFSILQKIQPRHRLINISDLFSDS